MFKAFSTTAAACLSVLALSAPIAHASLINNYTFDGSTDLVGTTLNFAGDVASAPAVTVSAYLQSSGTWGAVKVRRNDVANALGVDSRTNNSGDGDTGNQATVGPRVEGLMFDLGSVLYGSFKLDFSLFTGADRANIWASTSDIIANNFVGAVQVGSSTANNPFTANDLSFRYIFVANTDSPYNGNCAGAANQSTTNCFRVDNLQVVSEPGSLALMSAALLLVGTQRRRRSL
jgi:hypothetical protein